MKGEINWIIVLSKILSLIIIIYTYISNKQETCIDLLYECAKSDASNSLQQIESSGANNSLCPLVAV